MRPAPLRVACPRGLEALLARELVGLGLTAHPGASEVRLPGADARVVNLWSSLASRVWLSLGPAEDVSPASLAPYLRRGQAATLEGGSRARTLRRVLAAAGHPVQAGGLALDVTPDGVAWVDTSGEHLHFRGWRQEVGRAPLRETLAAAVLALGGHRPAESCWDPLCGSGTLLIEAAGRTLGLAPGRLRRFAFQDFPGHDEASFQALPRTAARAQAALLGSDLNAGALGTARRNARRAGVLEALTLSRQDALTITPGDVPPGLVVANLPYGVRVGAPGEAPALARALGRHLQEAFAGWRYALLLPRGVEAGLPQAGRQAVSNGGIPCDVVWGPVADS